eukprot:284817129_1
MIEREYTQWNSYRESSGHYDFAQKVRRLFAPRASGCYLYLPAGAPVLFEYHELRPQFPQSEEGKCQTMCHQMPQNSLPPTWFVERLLLERTLPALPQIPRLRYRHNHLAQKLRHNLQASRTDYVKLCKREILHELTFKLLDCCLILIDTRRDLPPHILGVLIGREFCGTWDRTRQHCLNVRNICFKALCCHHQPLNFLLSRRSCLSRGSHLNLNKQRTALPRLAIAWRELGALLSSAGVRSTGLVLPGRVLLRPHLAGQADEPARYFGQKNLQAPGRALVMLAILDVQPDRSVKDLALRPKTQGRVPALLSHRVALECLLRQDLPASVNNSLSHLPARLPKQEARAPPNPGQSTAMKWTMTAGRVPKGRKVAGGERETR